jgi:hypothetical protein
MKQTSASIPSASVSSSPCFSFLKLACALVSPAADVGMILFPSTPTLPRFAPLPPRRPPLPGVVSPARASTGCESPPRPLPRPCPPRPLPPPRALAGGAEASFIVFLSPPCCCRIVYTARNNPLGICSGASVCLFVVADLGVAFCLTWDEVQHGRGSFSWWGRLEPPPASASLVDDYTRRGGGEG